MGKEKLIEIKESHDRLGEEESTRIRDRILRLEKALDYTKQAQAQLRDVLRWRRARNFMEGFLRPLALTRTTILVALLTVGLKFLGLSLHWSFSLAVLCTMVPLLWFVWTKEGGEDWSGCLSDVHCSDAVVMELGMESLLEWPRRHPELALEEGARWQELWESVEARCVQLERAIEVAITEMKGDDESERRDD